jgi:hypothetical protein
MASSSTSALEGSRLYRRGVHLATTPRKAEQALISKWHAKGAALLIDAAGALAGSATAAARRCHLDWPPDARVPGTVGAIVDAERRPSRPSNSHYAHASGLMISAPQAVRYAGDVVKPKRLCSSRRQWPGVSPAAPADDHAF